MLFIFWKCDAYMCLVCRAKHSWSSCDSPDRGEKILRNTHKFALCFVHIFSRVAAVNNPTDVRLYGSFVWLLLLLLCAVVCCCFTLYMRVHILHNTRDACICVYVICFCVCGPYKYHIRILLAGCWLPWPWMVVFYPLFMNDNPLKYITYIRTHVFSVARNVVHLQQN